MYSARETILGVEISTRSLHVLPHAKNIHSYLDSVERMERGLVIVGVTLKLWMGNVRKVKKMKKITIST